MCGKGASVASHLRRLLLNRLPRELHRLCETNRRLAPVSVPRVGCAPHLVTLRSAEEPDLSSRLSTSPPELLVHRLSVNVSHKKG